MLGSLSVGSFREGCYVLVVLWVHLLLVYIEINVLSGWVGKEVSGDEYMLQLFILFTI